MSKCWNEIDYLAGAKHRFPCEIGNKTYTLKDFLEGYIRGLSQRNIFIQVPGATAKFSESLAFAKSMLDTVNAKT